VKNALLKARLDGARQLGIDVAKLTVDSPVPYVLGDPSGLDECGEVDGARYEIGFVGAVNAQRPTGRDKGKHEDYSKILRKLDALRRDARLAFLMTPWDGISDLLPDVLGQLLGSGSPVRIIDLSGIPNEIAGTASAAVARIVFTVKLWQTTAERESSPILLVCEEAHRYVPNSGAAQYEAAQSAIRRLAKEGRKYGIGLMLVSQRPSEVEATVLSQCNSWLVLRVTNEADAAHVRAILPDSMVGLSSVLSGLRRQEAVFVGQAAAIPSRITIRTLRSDQLPRSNDVDFSAGWKNPPLSTTDLETVAMRWRYQQRGT
jgi:hypothetical protein